MQGIQRASTRPFYSRSHRQRADLRADAKNKASSAAGLLQFTKQTWLENMKTFGGKHGLSRLADQISSVKLLGHLVVDAPAGDRIWALRNDPRIATNKLVKWQTRLDYQQEQSKDRQSANRGFIPHPCFGGDWSQPLYRGGHQSSPSTRAGAVAGDVAWKSSGLFRTRCMAHATSLGAAYDFISVRFEQRRSLLRQPAGA